MRSAGLVLDGPTMNFISEEPDGTTARPVQKRVLKIIGGVDMRSGYVRYVQGV